MRQVYGGRKSVRLTSSTLSHASSEIQEPGLRCTVLMSPVWDQVVPRDLVSWILEDRLNVRFQLQIHKVIWPADATGV